MTKKDVRCTINMPVMLMKKFESSKIIEMNGFNSLTITKTCEQHDHYGMQDHLYGVSPKNPKQAVVVVKLLKEL